MKVKSMLKLAKEVVSTHTEHQNHKKGITNEG